MADVVALDHTFGGLDSPVPLSYLDDNFENITDALASLNAFSNYLVDTGAADAYAVTLGAGTTFTLAAGLAIQMKATNANTTASTLSVNGGPVKAIQNAGAALTKDELQANLIYNLMYDGTQWQLLSIIPKIGTSVLGITFGAAAVGVTYAENLFRFTKIGNLVTFNGVLILTSKGSSVGSALITGLPYANTGSTYPVSVNGASLDAAATTSLQGYVTASATTINPSKFAAGARTQLANTDFANNSQLFLGGSYPA